MFALSITMKSQRQVSVLCDNEFTVCVLVILGAF